ncbi:MAG: NAD-dependent epimerase/dehydratase family protein [Kiritimatiellae bacterium]|nr:NAD-dependent epimerase/dehydratase family protein [Kiritimatiellia bacterium]
MKNVLVTGGAGFIGSHLVDKLVAEGLAVTVIDSLEAQVHKRFPDYLNPGARYFFSRVHAPTLNYAELLRDTDTVYYLASKVGPTQSMSDIADYTDANINSLGYFLQRVLDHGRKVRRFVLSASMGPYGEGMYHCDRCAMDFYPQGIRKTFEYRCPKCGGPAKNAALDESTEINNASYYGISKNVQETMLRLFAEAYGRQLVSLRYFSVYGPRQAFNNPYAGPIPIWILNAAKGKDLVVYEDGLQTRDFINVRDITNLNFRAGGLKMRGPVEIINCGAGGVTRIIEVARLVKKLTKSRSRIVVTKTIRPGDLRHSLADNSKLKRLMKYTKFISVPDGLASYIKGLRL